MRAIYARLLYVKRTHSHVSLILRSLQIFLLFFALFMPEQIITRAKSDFISITLFFFVPFVSRVIWTLFIKLYSRSTYTRGLKLISISFILSLRIKITFIRIYISPICTEGLRFLSKCSLQFRYVLPFLHNTYAVNITKRHVVSTFFPFTKQR